MTADYDVLGLETGLSPNRERQHFIPAGLDLHPHILRCFPLDQNPARQVQHLNLRCPNPCAACYPLLPFACLLAL